MADEAERIVIAPGPVHVPRSLMEAALPMHHRSDAFRAIVRETEGMLQELLRTGSPVYIVTASGTGAMEAAAVNIARAGDSVLVVSGGKFGDRWGDIFDAFGCRTHVLRIAWGREIDIDGIIAAVEDHRPDVVACTHVESSTGLLLDLEGLAGRLPEPRPLLVVDAIASLGVESLSMDDWGIDAVAAASQKAFAAPPGLGIVALSERARSAAASRALEAPRGSFYFDLARYETGRERGDAPFTPALQTIQIMHHALERQRQAGWDRMRMRHRQVSDAFIEAAGHLALGCFPERPSAAVQAFALPAHVPEKDVLERLESLFGIIAAGGQGELAGKIVRTGFLGLYSGTTLRRIVFSLAAVLSDFGCSVDVASAQDALKSVRNLPGLLWGT
jgi:aspartate aminotransferase-like enzyme